MTKYVNRFVISDTHFGHANSWAKFKNPDGTPLRPFTSNEEMDNTMVERWNEVVKPHDTVYHLGDVVIARKNLKTLERLNGRKILIMGNHDPFKNKDYYAAGFEALRGVNVTMSGGKARWVMTHIPIHPDSIARFRVNVHGHLHGNRVMLNDKIDPRYMSVCVEQQDYRPVHFDELEKKITAQFEKYKYAPNEDPWGNNSGPD